MIEEGELKGNFGDTDVSVPVMPYLKSSNPYIFLEKKIYG